MKTIAYYALHYGKEYLAWSIRSVQDAIDEVHILYSDRPSHGHDASGPCPENEEELRKEACRFQTKPIFWHKGRWGNEGEQRDSIYPIAEKRGADTILVVDADELWDNAELTMALDRCAARPEKNVRVRFLHFWRSLR